ncbi:ATP-dependent RNA helicase A [Cichlidogyrus casuarinus]|uniref:ATP-dependent RNA helicase A n=1 Tax=Cichlidogyrus casuarinus TaxID=1844966 RepID=A0ABD2PXK1_9PLAT
MNKTCLVQVWSADKARFGEAAMESICMQKQLNNAALRMIEDAANQIRTILISIGFPEPALSDSAINFGDMHSVRCDQLRFILTLGLYPNICFHSDKRKLLTMEGKMALCNKASVNCPSSGTRSSATARRFALKLSPAKASP